MTIGILLFLGFVCGIAATLFYNRRRGVRETQSTTVPAGHPMLTLSDAPRDRYQVVTKSWAWTGNDSAEASRAIARAREERINFVLYVDGVIKNRG